jgi:lysozyme family protein
MLGFHLKLNVNNNQRICVKTVAFTKLDPEKVLNTQSRIQRQNRHITMYNIGFCHYREKKMPFEWYITPITYF